MSPLAIRNRDLLLEAILNNGPAINPNINVALLADPVTNYLLAQPVMRLLGEEK